VGPSGFGQKAETTDVRREDQIPIIGQADKGGIDGVRRPALAHECSGSTSECLVEGLGIETGQ
jgi:hypothetical protein